MLLMRREQACQLASAHIFPLTGSFLLQSVGFGVTLQRCLFTSVNASVRVLLTGARVLPMVELLPPPTGLWSLPNIPLFLSLSVKLKLVQLAYRKAERKPLFSLAQDLVVVVLASHEPQSPFLLLSSLRYTPCPSLPYG